MRNRRQPRSTSKHRPTSDALQPPRQGAAQAQIGRLFTPSDLDLDDVAEAIRLLMRQDQAPDINPFNQPENNLLSFPGRVTHVVEATEAP